MQTEIDVRDAIHARAIEARERNGGSDSLQDSMQDGESEPAKTWWRRFFKLENLTVAAGRTIEKGLVITPTMGLTIVLSVGTVVGTMYWRTTDAIQTQSTVAAKESRELRDMMIETKTRLDERTNFQKEAESERKREQKDNEEIAKVWRETITQRMNDIDKKRR